MASVHGVDDTVILDPRVNASALAVNRLMAAGASVGRFTGSQEQSGIAPGAFIASGLDRATIAEIIEASHVAASSAPQPPSYDVAPVRAPRIGLYRSFRPNGIDEGWTRFIFEQYEFDFQTVRSQDIRQGELSDQFDVIVLPQQSARDILDGNSGSDYPAEFAGGIGEIGAARLRQFVHRGGTLVTLDSACELAIKYLYLPVTNVLEGIKPEEFYNPGSLLRLILDPRHPVAFGYGPRGGGDVRQLPGVRRRIQRRERPGPLGGIPSRISSCRAGCSDRSTFEDVRRWSMSRSATAG